MEIETEVLDILRRTALSGSRRPVGPDEPLGELGVGLDSLALIEFATAIEKRFQIQLPDEMWVERSQLSLGRLSDWIHQSISPSTIAGWEALQPPPVQPDAAEKNISLEVEAAPASNQTIEYFRILGRRLTGAFGSFYQHEEWYILEFRLTENPLPSFSPAIPVQVRPAALEDRDPLHTFWNSFTYETIDGQKMDMTLFKARLDSGAICLAAWRQEQIIGMDWLFTLGYRCPYSGLTITWPPDTCYGGELWEHAAFHGQGVGMSLLSASLAAARKAGYLRQVTLVKAHNTKMLSAAVQLYGFEKIGTISVNRLRRRPFSIWHKGGKVWIL
ncbi:acyl carrier protein [bacterium]|nr:acyl carrier protein [bacterium]